MDLVNCKNPWIKVIFNLRNENKAVGKKIQSAQ